MFYFDVCAHLRFFGGSVLLIFLVVFLFCLRIVSCVSVSMDCPFLFTTSVFPNVFFLIIHIVIPLLNFCLTYHHFLWYTIDKEIFLVSRQDQDKHLA